MARTKKLDLTDLTALRRARNENQSAYWNRIGVTQSAGSRYENERGLPAPTAILLTLFELGVITEKDIAAARKAGGVA